MRQIADLHIHSRFSRACSKELTLANIDQTCRIKGVDIIATGDFTYPEWFREIKENLVEASRFDLKHVSAKNTPRPGCDRGTPLDRGDSTTGFFYSLKSAQDDEVKFILSTELALIYKKFDRVRRIHVVVTAPNMAAAEELNKYLDAHYNIRSDGRPILGMDAEALCKVCFAIHPKFLIYPAHIWTPWFSVFGSKSGFDTMEECFGDFTPDIFAYETGLSSDPEMNWRLSALDSLTLLSNSDAHSLPNIGREANVFELENVSYDAIYDVVKYKRVRMEKHGIGTGHCPVPKDGKSYLDYTIEFYPEEGMYHYDGHRACGVRFTPAETKKHKGICPVCKKPVVIGVEYRVDELADRPIGFRPDSAPGFRKLVELDKIIAEAIGIKSRSSIKVQSEYKSLVKQAGTEMAVLLDLELAELEKMTLPEVVEGIRRVRAGELTVEPGFDGQYGKVKIFSDDEKKKRQKSLI